MAYNYVPSNISAKDKMNVSTWCLQIAHSLHNVSGLFANTFLVSRLMEVNAAKPLSTTLISVALYYICVYVVMFFVNTLLGYAVDRSSRIWYYRFGIILKGAFIFLVIFVGSELSKFAWLAGVIYGLAESAYYSSFNVIKGEMIPRAQANKYVVWENVFNKSINVIFPIILGVMMDKTTYLVVCLFVMGIVAIQLILSFFVKCQRPAESRFEFFKYLKILKNNTTEVRRIKNYYPAALAYGGTKIHTALIALLAMYTYNSNTSLGVFTAVSAVAAILSLLLFKYLSKTKAREITYVLAGIIPVVVSVLAAFYIQKWTYILFSLVMEMGICMLGGTLDVQRTILLKKTGYYEFTSEHQALTEMCFNLIRVLTFVIMLVLGLTLNVTGLKITIVIVSLSFPLMSLFVYRLEKVEAKYPIEYSVVSVTQIEGENNEN